MNLINIEMEEKGEPYSQIKDSSFTILDKPLLSQQYSKDISLNLSLDKNVLDFSSNNPLKFFSSENGNSNADISSDETSPRNQKDDARRVKSLMKLIIFDYKEERQKELKNPLLPIKERIEKVVNRYKVIENMFNVKRFRHKGFSAMDRFIMHPELSPTRKIIDTIFLILSLWDFFWSPFEFFVEQNTTSYLKDFIVDFLFFMEILSQFFTAYFKGKILIRKPKKIAKNYLKFKFFLDLVYVFPFYLIRDYLFFFRFLKIYKCYKILDSHVKIGSTWLLSFFIKNIKIITGIMQINMFVVLMFYFLHFSTCIWIYIGRASESESWINAKSSEWLVFDDYTDWELYTVGIFFMIETFSSIGYGDLPPKNFHETLFIMFCEVINVGLFAYLVSCIISVLKNFMTDEMSFKIQKEADVNGWMRNYYKHLPDKMKNLLITDKTPIFDQIKKYFLLYHKNGIQWINQFDFIKYMKPADRNALLSHTFSELYSCFHLFFGDVDNYIRNQIALQLRIKIISENEIIISEFSGHKKNEIKYVYLIGKGSVQMSKSSEDIFQFKPESYFGDELLLRKKPQFSYINNNLKNSYLLLCPYTALQDLFNYHVDFYILFLYKTLFRFQTILNTPKQDKDIFNETERPSNIINPYKMDDFINDIDNNKKLEINEELLGNLSKLSLKHEKYLERLQLVLQVEKKLEFSRYQIESVKNMFEVFQNKSQSVIDSFSKNDHLFHN
jgi:hypothetical protein